jgi:hypothetical protein
VSERAEMLRLAEFIRHDQPGWSTRVQIILTLPEGQQEWTGGYAVVARFEGDWQSYIVRSFDDWAILKRQLMEGKIS